MELSEGYRLEEVENGVQVLKRPGGYALAAFGDGVNPENIRRVAEADIEYLEAQKLDGGFGLGRYPDGTSMFGQDLREARERYLLALEAAYRE